MKFEFSILDLYSFLETKGYIWDKKAFIDGEYKKVTKQYINDTNNSILSIIVLNKTEKVNLRLNVSSTKLTISCMYQSPKDFDIEWCEFLASRYGLKYVDYLKEYNHNFIKEVTKKYEKEKQIWDEKIKNLQEKTKTYLEKYDKSQEIINKFYYNEKIK